MSNFSDTDIPLFYVLNVKWILNLATLYKDFDCVEKVDLTLKILATIFLSCDYMIDKEIKNNNFYHSQFTCLQSLYERTICKFLGLFIGEKVNIFF